MRLFVAVACRIRRKAGVRRKTNARLAFVPRISNHEIIIIIIIIKIFPFLISSRINGNWNLEFPRADSRGKMDRTRRVNLFEFRACALRCAIVRDDSKRARVTTRPVFLIDA